MRAKRGQHPGLFAAKQLDVRSFKDIPAQVLHIFPDRHVKENALRLESVKIVRKGRKPVEAGRVLEPPDKAGTPLRERVDLSETRNHAGHRGGIKPRRGQSDIGLRETKPGFPAHKTSR